MAKKFVPAGITSQTFNVFLQDRSSGDGVITLTTDKVKIAYSIGSTGPATTVALVGRNSTSAWTSGGWAEVSSTLAPGMYKFDIPDAALASTPGVSFAVQCSTLGQNFIPVAAEIQIVNSTGHDIPADTRLIKGTTVTARDIGASVLLSSGTGTGQIVLTSGNPTVLLSSGTGTGQIVLASGIPSVGVVTISTAAGNSVADQVLDRDMNTGTDSGSPTVRTVRQALRFLRNKWSISGGTLTVTKEDDTTASWTSAVTTSATADPIIASDPA